MHPRRAPGPDPVPADAAARRLALIAAEAGAPRPSTPASVVPAAGEDAWWSGHTRVAERAPAAEVAVPGPPPDPSVAAPPLPLPGRHAARRRWRMPVARAARAAQAPRVPRLPGVGPAHVAVVAVLVAVGLAVTTWWVARDRAEPVAPVSAQPVAPLVGVGATASGSPEGAATAATGSVTVDVAGEVRRPGIVVLDQGARVTDALEAAGGARRGVDLTPINLARVLVDGEQVVVGPRAGAAGPAGPAGAGGGSGSGGAVAPGGGTTLVNLNIAAQAELETLPGVGPVTAQAILAWRDQHGGFTSIEELLEVDGIGEKTLASLAPLVTV